MPPMEIEVPNQPAPARVTNPLHDPDANKFTEPSTGRPKPPEGWWETVAEWTDGNNVNEKIQKMKYPGGHLVRSIQVWKNRDGMMRRCLGVTFVADKGK